MCSSVSKQERKKVNVGLQRPRLGLPEQTHTRVHTKTHVHCYKHTRMKTCTASIHTILNLHTLTGDENDKQSPKAHTHRVLSHKTPSTEHNRLLLSISAHLSTVQTIQFSTMHLICPSGLVRIPNHFNSLVKLAKHFLISLNTATAQC